MADDKIRLEIDVDAKKAQSEIDAFGKNSAKIVSSAEKDFKSFGSSAKNSFSSVATAFASVTAGLLAFKKAIGEATESEKAIRSLSFAIAGTGEFSKEAIEGLQGFAESLSDLTGIDDDVVVSQLALAKSFGISNDQAKELVKAAANLSAVTGQDLESSVRQLGGTFDGTLGKIANLGPEFRNLTQEQIENGAAIDLLNKKYPDAAKSLGDSFEGSLNRLTNQFNDAFKVIGQEILGDPTIRNSIDQIGKSFASLAPIISSVTKAIITGFKVIVTGASSVAGVFTGVFADLADSVGLDQIASGLRNVSIATLEVATNLGDFSTATDSAKDSASALDKTLQTVSKNAEGFGNKASKSAIKAAEAFKKAQEDAQRFINDLILKTGSSVEIAGKKAGEAFAKVDDLVNKGLITEQQAQEARLAIVSEVNEKIVEDSDKTIKKILEAEEKANAEREKFTTLATTAGQSAIAGGDAQAQKKNVGSVVTSVASAFGPIFGGIASFASSIASLTKEQAKEFIKGFVEAIPEFVIALVENIPELIQGFIEALAKPELWQRVAVAFVRAAAFAILGPFANIIANALSKFGPEILAKIQSGFSDFFSRLSSSLSSAFEQIGPRIFEGIRGIGQIISNSITRPFTFVFNPLLKAIEPLTNAINALKENVDKIGGLGGKGGGSGIIAETAERIGSAIGLAKGGIVPMYAAAGAFVPRGTDTVPAMLTPGELVVPRDMVGQLGGYLDKQDSSKSDAILMAILQAVQEPMTVNAEAVVNQQAFADIILQLSRRNSRLSA